MRFSTSIISFSIAALALAAPLKQNSQDLTSLFEDNSNNNFNSQNQNLANLFSSNSLSESDILQILTSSFNLNNFNSQFSSSFDNNNIAQLLLELEGNSFGNSNFNNINDLSQFNLNSFTSSFNGAFQAGWNTNEIEELLIELGLINQNSFGSNNEFFSGNDFSNSVEDELFGNGNELSDLEAEIVSSVSFN